MALPRMLRAFGLLVMSRRIAIFSWTWATAVSGLVATHGFPSPLPMALVLLSMAGSATCVYTYNDIVDLEMDKLNSVKCDRPLPSGKVSRKEALNLVFLSGFVGIASNLLLKNLNTLLLSLVWIASGIAYSTPRIRFKKRFLVKESTIAMNFIVTSLIGGTAMGSVSWGVIYSGIFLCVFTLMATPAISESSDIEEDQKFGMKTLAVILSWKTKVEMIIVFVLAVMTLTPLTYVQLGFNFIFPIIVVAAGLLVLRSLLPLTSRIEKIAYESGQSKSFNTTFAFFMLAEVAMVLGSIQF